MTDAVVMNFVLLFAANFVISQADDRGERGCDVSQAVPRSRPYKRRGRDLLGPFEQAGEQLLFWWEVIRNIPLTIRQYGKQIGTILAELSLGTGVFIIGGGVVGVVILLSTLTGSEVGFEGHNGLSVIGLAPLTGFISAYLNTREMAPIVASLGFAARIGCGFTSRLGAMRISEEIDALEAMAIRPIPYLVTTRLIAGDGPGAAALPDRAGRHLPRHQRDGDRLLRPVARHLPALLPGLRLAGRRPLLRDQGRGDDLGGDADPLLLRVHRERRARRASARPPVARSAPASSRSPSSTSS